ncbi:fumarylacetoacetate hydrolase family protein [Comamonas kerstersii]
MKLVRYGQKGAERPGIFDANGSIRDVSAHIADWNGDALSSDKLKEMAALDLSELPVVEGNPRIGPCVGNVGKLICTGLNYADHAAESNMDLPTEPLLFMKATSAICGPYDDLQRPVGSQKLDWEVELAIVIGTQAKNVSVDKALEHVAGYCVINDVTDRGFQLERGGQWMKGKSADTFAPLGPWLVTKDEVADVKNLGMWLDVDQTRRQDGSTKTMVFSVETIVSYISQFMTLNPGDVIATGTPPGVGMGIKPQPVYLENGQVIKAGIQGLGEQRQKVVA